MTLGFEKVNKYTLEMFPDYVPKKADTVWSGIERIYASS